MKKRNKVILIVLSSLLGVVVFYVALCIWSLYSFHSNFQEFAENFVVEYRTPEELSGIAGVSIPRAELIDSCFIDHYSMGGYTIKAVFAIPQNDHKSLLRKLSKGLDAHNRWGQNEDGFEMFFYPDLHDSDWSDGIDDRKVELDGEMIDDWDGYFFGMIVPKDSCRIILKYGWYSFQMKQNRILTLLHLHSRPPRLFKNGATKYKNGPELLQSHFSAESEVCRTVSVCHRREGCG